MKRLVGALVLALLAAPIAAEAQQTGDVYRIGILSTLAVADISGANPTHALEDHPDHHGARG